MQQFDLTYGDFNPHLLYVFINKKTDRDGYDHSHDFLEITYILSGQSRYIIEGKEYILKTGDILMGNPGLRHQYKVIDTAKPPIEFIIGLCDIHFRDMPSDTIVLPKGGYIMHCKAELRQEINQLCYLMEAENNTQYCGKYFMLKAYLMQMLLLIIRENSVEKKEEQQGYIFESNNKSYVVKKIISYLNENYNSHISLEKIAHNMYLSPVYISKIFKEETGESPINYLIQIRLDKAKEILSNPHCGSIRSVAYQVGYEDVYYFSKLFKKHFGIAPAFYKKQMSESDS